MEVGNLWQVLGGVSERTVRFFFDMYDDDGSGNVEAAEIIKWVRKAQVQGDGDDIDVATQAQTILSAFDNNNNASIDFEEFKVSGACAPWQPHYGCLTHLSLPPPRPPSQEAVSANPALCECFGNVFGVRRSGYKQRAAPVVTRREREAAMLSAVLAGGVGYGVTAAGRVQAAHRSRAGVAPQGSSRSVVSAAEAAAGGQSVSPRSQLLVSGRRRLVEQPRQRRASVSAADLRKHHARRRTALRTLADSSWHHINVVLTKLEKARSHELGNAAALEAVHTAHNARRQQLLRGVMSAQKQLRNDIAHSETQLASLQVTLQSSPPEPVATVEVVAAPPGSASCPVQRPPPAKLPSIRPRPVTAQPRRPRAITPSSARPHTREMQGVAPKGNCDVHWRPSSAASSPQKQAVSAAPVTPMRRRLQRLARRDHTLMVTHPGQPRPASRRSQTRPHSARAALGRAATPSCSTAANDAWTPFFAPSPVVARMLELRRAAGAAGRESLTDPADDFELPL